MNIACLLTFSVITGTEKKEVGTESSNIASNSGSKAASGGAAGDASDVRLFFLK